MPVIKHKSIHCSLEEWAGKNYDGEGRYLPTMLECAVPLWMLHYRDAGPTARQAELDRLNAPEYEFVLKLEYVLHRGPKKGDSARAFNDLAKCIAILSFCPGGVCVFGTRYQWRDSTNKVV